MPIANLKYEVIFIEKTENRMVFQSFFIADIYFRTNIDYNISTKVGDST